MEPVSTLLLQALTLIGGAAGGAVGTEVTKRAVGEAWDAVKKAVQRRFGKDHEAPMLIDELRRAEAGSMASKLMVKRLDAFELDKDAEIVALTGELAQAVTAAQVQAAAGEGQIHAGKVGVAIGVNRGTLNIGDIHLDD